MALIAPFQRIAPLLATVVLVSAVLVAAVHYGHGHDRPGRPHTELPTLKLPLESFMTTAEEQDTVSRAYSVLFQRCMHAFGFDLPDPGRRISASPDHADNAARYGLTDERRASSRGYHPDTRRTSMQPGGTDLSAAARTVASGIYHWHHGRRVPPGGCMGEAGRLIAAGGPTDADPNLAFKLDFTAGQRSEQHPAVRTAFGAWSKCMARAGYDYDSPWDANDDPRFRTRLPSTLEISAAVADVRCKRQVDLIDIWVSADVEMQRAVIKQFDRELARSKQLLQTMVRNARRTLSDHRGH